MFQDEDLKGCQQHKNESQWAGGEEYVIHKRVTVDFRRDEEQSALQG